MGCDGAGVKTIDRNELALAAGLTAVAGFVDAVAFVHLGGYFISFMSGNTTKMSSSFVDGLTVTALRCLSIIGLFVVGVMVGSFIRRLTVGDRGRMEVLYSVTTLLGVSAVIAVTWSGYVSLMVGAVAMGTLNSVFEKSGEVSVGLTYMTGTLVKAAQRLVDAAFGGPRWLWARHFLLWAAMAVGALGGAGAHRELGMSAMWLPFATVALLTVFAMRITAGQKV